MATTIFRRPGTFLLHTKMPHAMKLRKMDKEQAMRLLSQADVEVMVATSVVGTDKKVIRN